MSAPHNDQDLLPEQTEGFKVGEKKTMDEINKLGEPPEHYPKTTSTGSLALRRVLKFWDMSILLHFNSCLKLAFFFCGEFMVNKQVAVTFK